MMPRWLAVSFVLLIAGLTCLAQAQSPIAGFPPGTFQSRAPLDGSSALSCSQATTYLARTTITPGSATANNYSNFICGMVLAGLITGDMTAGGTACGSTYDAIYLFDTIDTTTAIQNLCSTNFSLIANGSPTFTANQGYTGVDGSTTVYLDTQLSPTLSSGLNLVLNSQHVSIWSNGTAASVSGGAAIGISAPVSGTHLNMFPRFVDNNMYARLTDATDSGAVGVPTDGSGYFVGNRSGSSATQGYRNASLLGSPNATSGTLGAATIYILAMNGGVDGPELGYGNPMLSATIGGSLSGTNVTNSYNLLHTFHQQQAGIP